MSTDIPTTLWKDFRKYALVFAIYVLATWITNAHIMADTADYVDSILSRLDNGNYNFWEFGHLFWRPLGLLTFWVIEPISHAIVGEGARVNVTFALLVLCWIAGLLSVYAMRGLVGCVSKSDRTADFVTIGFIFAHSFLNYTQTGSSYVPGLSLVLLGAYILAASGDDPKTYLRTGVLAGLALAGAICMWFVYVLAIPAIVLLPLFLFEFDKPRLRLFVTVSLAFALFTSLAYIVVLANLGIHSLTGFLSWAGSASHGVTHGGVTRMIFGFARSFINMGNDGVLFKRFLVGDPFNPVSIWDVLRLSLWKLLLFYVLLTAITINLLRSGRGRRVLALLALAAIPVIGFTAVWQGGEMALYLPLIPLIFLSLAYSLSSERSLPALKIATLAFVGVTVIVNLAAMAKPVLSAQQESTASRIRDLKPLLKPQDRVITSHWTDPLINFTRSYPFDPLNRDRDVRLYGVIQPGTSQVLHWRRDVASQVKSVWEAGGDVWVTMRLFNARPLPNWNWVEGDDPNVSWTGVYSLFSRLETASSVGGDDGFALVPPTAKNKQVFESLAEEESLQTEGARNDLMEADVVRFYRNLSARRKSGDRKVSNV